MRVIHRKIRYFTYKITLLLFLSRDDGKHYSLLPVSKIGIFRDHVAPPDFAENTDMAKDLDYKTGLDFWGLLFFKKKNPRLIGGLIRYSNILKILQPKKENFQIKHSDIFHNSSQSIDCGKSLEPPHLV